jgi:hypothetical protein
VLVGFLNGLAGRPPLRRRARAVRRDLLRVLTSSSEVRADVIRQFHERGSEMAELLILL